MRIRVTRRAGLAALGAACAIGLLGVGSPGHASAAKPKCTIKGTKADDRLRGTPRGDVICGRGGDDRLVGGGGDDLLRGDRGVDFVKGGDGADLLDGARDRDRLRGGTGPDLISGGASRDFLYGEPENDVLWGGGGTDYFDGGPGDDIIDGVREDRPDCSRALQPATDAFQSCLTQGPRLDWVAIQPDFLYVGEQTKEAELEVGVRDWLASSRPGMSEADVTSVTVVLRSDKGELMERTIGCNYTEEFLARCRAPLAFGPGSASATWSPVSVRIDDNTGHWSLYEGNDLRDPEFTGELRPPIQVEVYGEPDHAAPVLEELEITPSTIDTSSGPVDVHIRARFTDDGMGMERAMLLWLGSPLHPNGFRGDWHERTAGDASDSTFEFTHHLARHSAVGEYPIGVKITDRAGNELELKPADLAAAGFDNGYEQTGGPGDGSPPELRDLDVLTTWSDSYPYITVRAHVVDDLSGLRSGVRSPFGDAISILISGYDNCDGALVTYDAVRVSGTDTNGVWETRLVGASAVPAVTSILDLSIWDGAGNHLGFEPHELEDAGFPAAFNGAGEVRPSSC